MRDRLIARATEIDERLGPIPGRTADRLAGELRAAAALLDEQAAALRIANDFIEADTARLSAIAAGADIGGTVARRKTVLAAVTLAIKRALGKAGAPSLAADKAEAL